MYCWGAKKEYRKIPKISPGATTIRRTFRTYSYSNEVGHFVSCSEYVVTSDIFCRDTS